jgi:hypothetical protein
MRRWSSLRDFSAQGNLLTGWLPALPPSGSPLQRFDVKNNLLGGIIPLHWNLQRLEK